MIDIEGIIIAKVNDAIQLQSVEAWFDPVEMFRQIAREGGVVTQPTEGVEKVERASQEMSGCPFLAGKRQKPAKLSQL